MPVHRFLPARNNDSAPQTYARISVITSYSIHYTKLYETDRTPQADTAVMTGFTAQVIHGRGLELWQGGIPEETERRHHQRQPPVAGAGEYRITSYNVCYTKLLR